MAQEVLLDNRLGRFLLRNGEEVTIDLAPFSGEASVSSYLLGGLFGVLCHQRGIIPLHASVIEVAGGCVAFVGASGAGKSTTLLP